MYVCVCVYLVLNVLDMSVCRGEALLHMYDPLGSCGGTYLYAERPRSKICVPALDRTAAVDVHLDRVS